MVLLLLAFAVPFTLLRLTNHKQPTPSEVIPDIIISFAITVLALVPTFILAEYVPQSAYNYEAEHIELIPINGAYIAISDKTIFYVSDYVPTEIDNEHAAIHISATPYANYLHYRGYNKENKWRLLYTIPHETDRIEFYVPEDAIVYKYTLGGAK